MFYRVKSQPNPPHDGFRRGGRLFSASEWTYLSGAELSPELLTEPMLIIEEISEEEFAGRETPEPEDPRDVEIEKLLALMENLQRQVSDAVGTIGTLADERDAARQERDEAQAAAGKLTEACDELQKENDALRAQLTEKPAETESAGEQAATDKPASRRGQGGGK